jgi:hypothetical protein
MAPPEDFQPAVLSTTRKAPQFVCRVRTDRLKPPPGPRNFPVDVASGLPARGGTTRHSFTFPPGIPWRNRLPSVKVHSSMKQKKPLIVGLALLIATNAVQADIIGFQAENGTLGSEFNPAQTDVDASGSQYITTETDNPEDRPGSDPFTVSYSVDVPAGTYDVYVRARVDASGSAGGNDSFFYANAFGNADPAVEGDWQLINSINSDYGVPVGTFGWSTALAATVTSAGGVVTWEIGAREDGFDIDAFAFVTTGQSVTATDLDNALGTAPTATISWKTAKILIPSDVSTRGTLVEAVNYGGVETVINTVTFSADTTSNGDSTNLNTGGSLADQASSTDFYKGNSAIFDPLVDTMRWEGASGDTAADLYTLTGLTAGVLYEIQFFYADATNPWRQLVMDGSQTPYSPHTTGHVVTGTFTALSATQPFTLGMVDEGTNERVRLGAYQLRAIEAPVITKLNPKQDRNNVAVDANLVATFSEAVTAGTGSVALKRSADDSTVESFAVGSSPRLSFSDTKLTIDPTDDLELGVQYYIEIDAGAVVAVADSDSFAGLADPASWTFTAIPDLTTVDGRIAWLMFENINDPWPDPYDGNASRLALPCLTVNRNVALANALLNDFYNRNFVEGDRTAFDQILGRAEYFRIYMDPAMNARLYQRTRDELEDLMWAALNDNAKRPSEIVHAQGTTWALEGTENHDSTTKGGHLMCAIALRNAGAPYGPDRVLSDGHTLAEHADAWEDHFMRYFADRADEGINCEIASPIYAKYTVPPYYNIRDFAATSELRTLADRFLSLYWADVACDWTLNTERGGAQTRCPKDGYLRNNGFAFNAVLWAYGWPAPQNVSRLGVTVMAASSYRIPDIITACASDTNRPNYLYTSRRFGQDGFGADGYLITFPSHLRRDTFVTPDYTMGTLTFDMNTDYVAIVDQSRAMGVTFANSSTDRVMVFGKGAANNKSYADLSGVTRENCMVVQRDKNATSSGNETRIFVPVSLYDTRVESNGWLFLQSGNGYCAIKPATGGYSVVAPADGADHDLELDDKWAPIVIQMGQASQYASFADFQTSVQNNAFSYTNSTLSYTSEAGDTFTVYGNSKTTPKVNGTTVDVNPTKTYDSPYLNMVHGEETATFSYGGYPDLELEFILPRKPTISVVNSESGVIDVGATATKTISFNAGTADMLALSTHFESSAGISSITYAGEALTQIPETNGGGTRNSGVWTLGNPATTGDIVVTVSGGGGLANAMGYAVVSLASDNGAPIVVGDAGITAGGTDNSNPPSVTLDIPVDDSFVFASFGGNAGNTSTATTGAGALDQRLAIGTINSMSADAGYDNFVAAGTSYAYTFSTNSSEALSAAAASFHVASTFSAWIANPAYGLDPADQGLSLDPDGDHLPNGVEAWFGTHPGKFTPGLAGLVADGATFTVTHPWNENPPSDLVGSYEWSPNLVDWYDCDGVNSPDGGTTTVDVVDSTTVGGITTVTLQSSRTMDRLLLRLGVRQN